MHETGRDESYGPGHLTFDCPWCGAISGVGADLVGEHFECAECGKETKLTDDNTRHAHLAEPPKDAPHHDDSARLFSCPWCGNHAGIPPTHIGEYYDCPECHKRTKLTETTLPDAEKAEKAEADKKAKEEHHSVWPLGLAAVIVVGAILWALLGSGGKDEEPERGDRRSAVVDPAGDGEDLEIAVLDPEPEEATPGETEGTGTEDVEEVRTSVAFKVASSRLSKAVSASKDVRSDLDAYLAEHPDLVGRLEIQAVREGLYQQAQSLLEAIDAGAAGPADARAFNQKLSAYVAESPSRIALAEALLAEVVKQPVRPLRLRSWEQLNFHQPRVREALEHQMLDARSRVPDEYLALESAWQRAAQAVEAAQAEVDAAAR